MVAIPTARDAVSKYLVTLRPEMDLLEAIDILVKKHVSGAPVVDGEGQLVGVLTEKDCLRLLANSAWGEISGGQVSGYMSEIKAVIDVDMDLFAAAKVFLDCNFPILPLLEKGQLVGRVSRQDLLQQAKVFHRALQRQQRRDEKHRRRERPESGEQVGDLESSHTPEERATRHDELER